MASNCPAPPNNKQEYITEVGTILLKDYGKKKFYSPEEVKKASKKHNQNHTSNFDWHCWAMSIFSSHSDFDNYHKITGETCDYIAMKTEILKGFTNNASIEAINFTSEEIDASWLDFGDLSEGFFDGIGDIIGGIFEGL